MLQRAFTILCALTVSFLAFTGSASAGDTVAGKTVFNANCAACHMGGRNTIIPMKNLGKEALEKFDKFSPEAIVKQVTYGAGAMPRFGGRLKPEQIENVAAYVFDQAEKGW